MNIKTCLVTTAIVITLICVGSQAAVLLQPIIQPAIPAASGFQIFESPVGGPITPDGDGGDPVDGPGWPK